MSFRFVAIILSALLLLNAIAVDVINIFAPTKKEIRMQMKEGTILEFPCQFHDCGCTKETCFVNCCCKDNHEVFEELKKKENSCCEKPVQKSASVQLQKRSKISIVSKMICKKSIPPKNESILLKKELFSLTKTIKENFYFKDKVILIEYNQFCNFIKTQTTIQPENPPPNFS